MGVRKQGVAALDDAALQYRNIAVEAILDALFSPLNNRHLDLFGGLLDGR